MCNRGTPQPSKLYPDLSAVGPPLTRPGCSQVSCKPAEDLRLEPTNPPKITWLSHPQHRLPHVPSAHESSVNQDCCILGLLH
ncbi:hypothetical protein AAFF_G00342380 [Aldrovandia affinis]|uniref:Uncharacterized protein n=1 Tax=Aldrovandia affinis TaxID=143900 RepID=A0AAD7R6F1_9TELE|nr:hypothetical protein AAFF_G00342380 [Aldrovandia affinis]